MKKIFKRTLAIFMIALMALSCAPVGSFLGVDMSRFDLSLNASASTVPASGSCGENVTFTYDSTTKELVISGTGAMEDYNSHDDSPFYHSDIESVVITSGVTTIADCAFNACGSLTSITIPDSVTTIGVGAFAACGSLISVTIPDSVTTIGEAAFTDCGSLTSITIPDSVTTIGNGAFYYCNRLISITVDKDNQYYSNDEYGVLFDKNKTKLIQYTAGNSHTEYTIPDSVTTIGYYAFGYCTGLTSITIPDSVTTIGVGAFYSCKNLTDVIIPDSVTTIGYAAFENCTSLTSITIPDSVTTIGMWSFAFCDSLTSITIPDSVTTIGDGAFYDCDSLISVTIPDSVTTIGELAFNSCDSLTSIIVDKDNQYYSNDEYGVLFDKNKTKLIQYPVGNSHTEYTIPDSVTTIGDGAFACCISLTSVTIPDSVTTIGYAAFADCENLSDVYYSGTEAQWNAITIEDGNEYLTNATIHYNYCEHSFGEYIVKKQPTCTEPGEKTATCLLCSAKDTEAIPATGHKYNAVITAPTCVDKGYTTYTCSCGDSYTSDYVDTIDHNDNDGDEYCDYCGKFLGSDENNCSHICHKGGFMGFIWKIINFFQKLFGTNPVCECGMAHY